MSTFLSSLLFAFCFNAQAEIRETKSMAEALSVVQKGDVVVFDIDNTLLQPIQTLGSDQWYGSLVARYQKEGLTEDQAIDKAISEWIQVQKVMKVKTVEDDTSALVKSVQKKGVLTFALTARPLEIETESIRQLRSQGIRFWNHGFSYSDGKDIELNHGVLFVGPRNNKGIVLQKFFERFNIHPNRLIFIDDKVKHVNNMDEIFTKAGIANVNYRYGATDEIVKAFRSDIANFEWAYFKLKGVLISDQQAERKMKRPLR